MNALLLCIALGCSGDAVVEGPWRVASSSESFCAQRIDQPRQNPVTYEGVLVAINANGVLYQSQGQWMFLSENGVKELPSPREEALFSRMGSLNGPVFHTQTNMVFFRSEGWVSVPLEVFVEYRPPGLVPGSHYGLNIIYPQVLQQLNGEWWIYQTKSGILSSYDKAGKLLQKLDFGKDRRAIRWGSRIGWLGAPGESRISLAEASNPNEWISNLTINDLNKHSLSIKMAQGCWVFTFPSGIRDGLKSWDSGTLPIHAHYLTESNAALAVTRFSLGNLPLNFNLTTSSSGSPRLEVEPEFRVVPVAGTEAVVILTQAKQFILQPEKGLREVKMNGSQFNWAGFVREGADLGGYDNQGKWHICLKDGF